MAQTSEARSRIMRAIKSRDTTPELIVRRLAHRMGFRFRVCRRDLPGKPDVVFSRLRKIIFVHGCFWHGHDCGQGVRIPTQNHAYWNEKITRNAKRDEASQTALAALGWDVAVFWECELKDERQVAEKLLAFLGVPVKRQAARTGTPEG
jgi:DNA mismatch endonuclease (patch repair protein)